MILKLSIAMVDDTLNIFSINKKYGKYTIAILHRVREPLRHPSGVRCQRGMSEWSYPIPYAVLLLSSTLLSLDAHLRHVLVENGEETASDLNSRSESV